MMCKKNQYYCTGIVLLCSIYNSSIKGATDLHSFPGLIVSLHKEINL
jgi:hypothetical protein